MIQEFYEKINGDYTTAIARMSNDDRIKKYLKFFVMDESFGQLKTAIENGDCESAFRGAHTLKGVSQNMAFTELGTIVEEITELLRAKDFENAKLIFHKVEEAYNKVIDEINKLA